MWKELCDIKTLICRQSPVTDCSLFAHNPNPSSTFKVVMDLEWGVHLPGEESPLKIMAIPANTAQIKGIKQLFWLQKK